MKSFAFAASAAVIAFAMPAAAQAAVAYNSTPSAGWFFGTGNDYSPANTAVSTVGGGNEIGLRFHRTFEAAPASVGDTYLFALGTSPLSYDWSVTSNARSVRTTSLITIQNIGTGASVSYDPFAVGNDNAFNGTDTFQNSFRLNFIPGFFDPNEDGLYRVTFATNFGGGVESLSIDAQIGAGIPEPAAWAMMIGGFGLIGAAMRRRTTTKVTFA